MASIDSKARHLPNYPAWRSFIDFRTPNQRDVESLPVKTSPAFNLLAIAAWNLTQLTPEKAHLWGTDGDYEERLKVSQSAFYDAFLNPINDKVNLLRQRRTVHENLLIRYMIDLAITHTFRHDQPHQKDRYDYALRQQKLIERQLGPYTLAAQFMMSDFIHHTGLLAHASSDKKLRQNGLR